MFPHPCPTHAHLDAKILGLTTPALWWLAAGIGVGMVLSVLGTRLTWAVVPVLWAQFGWPAPYRTALVPLGWFLAGLLPCYALGRWRPRGQDPLVVALAHLRDSRRPAGYGWEPEGVVPAGGWSPDGPETDPDPEEEVR